MGQCTFEHERNMRIFTRLHLPVTWTVLSTSVDWFTRNLKLKTTRKYVSFRSYKIQSSVICFIALNIHEYPWSHDVGIVWHREDYIKQFNYQYITKIVCLCWVFILLGMISCLFSNCNKNSITRLRSLYIAFYLRCKCVTFLDARYSSQCKEAYQCDLLFIRSEEIHLWIVSSFKPSQLLNYMKCRLTSDTDVCIYYYHIWLYTNV